MNVWKIIRAIIGVAVVVVLLVVVNNYWGDYRLAKSAPRPAASTPNGSAVSTATIGVGTVKTANVNFRDQPNSTAKLIRLLKQGEKLTVISKEAEWYKVRDAKGQVGWVIANTDYIGLQTK